MSGHGPGDRLPQDSRVDRRSFLARMGALTAAAAAGRPFPLEAMGTGASLPRRSRLPGEADFWARLPEPGSQGAALEDLSAWEAGALLRRREVTSRELVEACLERIRRWDSVYQAFNALTEEEALRQADALDRGRGGATGRGGPSVEGLLHGIPLAIKDNFYTRGVATTANSHIFRDFVPEWTATAVVRLQEEGGVMLGKTQMGPLATTRALTPDGEITTLNAWAPGDASVNPGGSSSGSATATASRMALSSIGTQTGGSITAPALAQGLTGLKPTMGRVSLRGVIPLTYSRDHVGPLARDARDAALLLQAMAGPDPADPRTQGLPAVPDYLAAVSPWPGLGAGRLPWATRIGVMPGWADGNGAEAGLRRDFLREMEEAGADLVPVDPGERWRELSSGEMNSVRLPERSEPFLEWLREDVRLFGVSLSSWIQGLLLSGDEFVKGQRARHALLRLTLDRIFDRCDVVLLESHLAFDQTGLPLVALPVGFTAEAGGRRHPQGILVGGAPFGEERLLALAHTWQERTDHHRQRPPDPEAGDEARYRGRAPRGRLDVEAVAELSQ